MLQHIVRVAKPKLVPRNCLLKTKNGGRGIGLRINVRYCGLIENAFINFQDLICTSGTFNESVTDDLPNFLIIEHIDLKMKIKEKIVKRDFCKFEKEKLIKDFDELKINNKTDKMKTLNEKYFEKALMKNLLHEDITYDFDKNAPIHEISGRHENNKRKPWITNDILNSSKNILFYKH